MDGQIGVAQGIGIAFVAFLVDDLGRRQTDIADPLVPMLDQAVGRRFAGQAVVVVDIDCFVLVDIRFPQQCVWNLLIMQELADRIFRLRLQQDEAIDQFALMHQAYAVLQFRHCFPGRQGNHVFFL